MKDREETTHTARPKRERRKPAWMADYIYNQATATHPWEQAITELQENFDRQTVTNHQLIQKLINSVSRLETMVTTNTNAVVQPQVQGILGPSPDTHLQPSMQTENCQGSQRSVQTENGQGTQRFHIKLELPRFDGSDPHGWVFRIQEYFDFYDTPDTQRLRNSRIHNGGEGFRVVSMDEEE
nr:Transposon Ty3-G Gag-Pol polyprotein [Ipomoea batatas]